MADSNARFTLSDQVFRALVLAVAAVAVLATVRLRFCYPVTLPAKPPPPEQPELSVGELSRAIEADPATYAGYLAQDSRTYNVSPSATVESMSRVLRHRVDESRRELDPTGDSSSVEAAGLRLSLSVRDIEGRPERMSVLTVENLTDQPLAYRIRTEPDHGTKVCQRKRLIAHNAMAIAPGGREERSECIYRNGWTVAVTRVETVALPELGYHYLSQVPPGVVGIEPRLGRGHLAPHGSMCNVVLPAAIAAARDQGRTRWRDLVDFFARHRCTTYRFPEGYKAFAQDGERALPVTAPP